MPIYAIRCLDKPGALDLRLESRPAHMAYLGSRSEIRLAGALLDADDRPIGSMIIVEAADVAAARAIADGDPFQDLGVFESVEIAPWRISVGSF